MERCAMLTWHVIFGLWCWKLPNTHDIRDSRLDYSKSQESSILDY